MMTLNPLEIWIVAFFTLALFSFLYKDNAIYKIAEHIFAGLSAGYYVGLIWDTVIVQQLWDPIIQHHRWSLIIPGILGFLMFARFFKKISWVSRVSLAFVMGTTAGVFLVSQLHGLVLPQMQATMTPATELVSHDFDTYSANLDKFEIFDPTVVVDTLADTTLIGIAPAAEPMIPKIVKKQSLQLPEGGIEVNSTRIDRTIGDTVFITAYFTDSDLPHLDKFRITLKVRAAADNKEITLLDKAKDGNDGLTVANLGNGNYKISYAWKPSTEQALGQYAVFVSVERRAVMVFLTIIVVVGVLSTLIYFYFSKEHVGVLGVTAKVGIWFIMISFGAHFGYTVMGRVSLLIGRVQFLIDDWLGSMF
jgi:hypothetical protein